MANEARGLLFETITDAALKRAVEIAKIPGQVRWNEKPDKLSVVPDFTIGLDKDKPTHVILVTASGAARNSETKTWRNLAELQEVKAQLPNTPIVVNLYFMSELKQGLSAAAVQVYDTTINIDKKAYYPALNLWVQANLGSAAHTRDTRSQLLRDFLAKDPEFSSALGSLAKDLALALKARKAELDPLWKLMRADYLKAHDVPLSRRTSVRRGLAKLLVIEPRVRKLTYASYRRSVGIPIRELPEYLFDLNFFTRSITGGRLSDAEIHGVIDLLGEERCETILLHTPKVVSMWVNPLRDLPAAEKHVDFIIEHYSEIVNAAKLKSMLTECYNNPAGLSGNPKDEKVWLFEIIISLLKAKSGKLQGYGGAELARDSDTPEFGNGGFVIPPFVQRKKMLIPKHMQALATGLAFRFKTNIAPNDLSSLRGQVKTWVIKENLEDRLIPYRNFEPLLWLLEAELSRINKAYDPKVAYVGWLNEYAETGRKSATTPFVRVGDTLIHWKSGSDMGKVHKKKELSARARNVKYQYLKDKKTFMRRAGIHQLALIVDGVFDDEDLKVLSESGWDTIIYADEINQFVATI